MSAPHSRSGEFTPWRGSWPLIAVVVLPFVVRLVAASAIHLTEDEAYYRLWSFTPAFGYFDHPPMIAWWIWLGRLILGDNGLGVRLLPIASAAVTTLLVFDSARLAGATPRIATTAAVFYSAMLLVAAGGFLAVPDAAATLFWTATIWCALKARIDGSARWWLLAGLAAGLASLSKYSALFLAPGIVLWLAVTKEGRAALRQPGPWLAATVAIMIFGFNLTWNAQHHWLTFAKQFGRVTAGRFAPIHVAEFVAAQFILINPLIAVFAVCALARRGAQKESPLLLAPFVGASLPFAAYLLIHGLHDAVQAHWPAPLYPAIAVVAAGGAQTLGKRSAWLRAFAPWLGYVIGAAALAWLCIPGNWLALPADPALPIRGWREFAQNVERLRQRTGAAWIGAASYGFSAQLKGEPGVRAPVFELFERMRYRGLRLGPPPDLTRPGLVIDLPRRLSLSALKNCFKSATLIATLRRGDDGGPFTKYAVIRVLGPRADLLAAGCPTRAPSSVAWNASPFAPVSASSAVQPR